MKFAVLLAFHHVEPTLSALCNLQWGKLNKHIGLSKEKCYYPFTLNLNSRCLKGSLYVVFLFGGSLRLDLSTAFLRLATKENSPTHLTP
jgi:hypothetical protein